MKAWNVLTDRERQQVLYNFRRMMTGTSPFSFWWDELQTEWVQARIYVEE